MVATKLLKTIVLLLIPTTALANNYNEEVVYKLTQKGAMACLSHAVFKEANTEPELGKRMVIASILNRAIKDDKSICSVIKEKNQFSFYKRGYNFDKLTKTLTEKIVLDTLSLAMKGKLSSYEGITHFHTVTSSPGWSKSKGFVEVKRLGRHVFYRKKEI